MGQASWTDGDAEHVPLGFLTHVSRTSDVGGLFQTPPGTWLPTTR